MNQGGSFWGIGLFTLLGFPFIGMILLTIFPTRFIPNISFLFNSHNFLLDTLIGLAVGIGLGFVAYKLSQHPIVAPSAERYSDMLSSLKLNYPKIIFLSFCAGFGEEVLFRGILQHYWGIWPTAVVFVAIHGYLNPKDWRISVYGLFMTVAMAGLGYLAEWVDLWAAIWAHFAIDLVLFIQYKRAEDLEAAQEKLLAEEMSPSSSEDEITQSLED